MSKQNPQQLHNQQKSFNQINEQSYSLLNEDDDYKAIRSNRIHKLQQILMKNNKVRHYSIGNSTLVKLNPSYTDFNVSNKKLSLPLIKLKPSSESEDFMLQIKKQSFNKQSHIKVKQARKSSQLPQQFSQKAQIINKGMEHQKQHIINSFIYSRQKESKENRSYMKLKVKNFQLQSQKDQYYVDKLDKRSIKNSLQKTIIAKKSLAKESISIQTQQKASIRQRKRNISSLNLTKIEHLPQIIFPRNKKCSRPKFPTSSMADIDRNLLINQIIQLQEKSIMEKKTRQKNQVMFKERIKNHRSVGVFFVAGQA